MIWLIRLEGVVKHNAKEIMRIKQVEERTNGQDIKIAQRDEEMRAIKLILDELKNRVFKVEGGQVSMGETLARIETKLDIMMKSYDSK